jgi:hypothetical protein
MRAICEASIRNAGVVHCQSNMDSNQKPVRPKHVTLLDLMPPTFDDCSAIWRKRPKVVRLTVHSSGKPSLLLD